MYDLKQTEAGRTNPFVGKPIRWFALVVLAQIF